MFVAIMCIGSKRITVPYLLVEKYEIDLEEDKSILQNTSQDVKYIATGAETIIQESNFKEFSYLNININETSNTKY